ncbi:putative porin [Chlorobium sp. N1]|uniref:putative porin n=1 Tax=Chlorobium sp. N1 TaxID=2491138 RepID=UPI00103E5169|nr:putative porin [Chlorobium sp. N1]TCD48438.1 hypothetical protein E0L29_00680 [Chlorobium sp. N1]
MKKTAFLIGLAAVLGFSSNAQAIDWNWKGDIRYRYQSQLLDDNVDNNSTDHSRDRHRIRVRLGADMWINEELSSGFEIRTGSDATSANSTFGDTGNFDGDTISLSEGYINYHPMLLNGDVNILLGKRYSKETLTVMDDLIWDGDVTLEGMTLQYGKDAKGKEKDGFSANLGYYVYDYLKASDATDAYLFAVQGSYKGTVSDLAYQIGASYYDYCSIGTTILFDAKYSDEGEVISGDTPDTPVTPFANLDFNIVEFFGNIGGKVSSLPWKAYGQYAFNTAKHSEYSEIQDGDRNAYLVGLKLGKAKNPGQLEGYAEYYHIEEDAVNNFMTDSDRGELFGVHTNIQGWKTGVKYALIQNMTLGLTYFNDELINAGTATAKADDRGHLLQADVVVKF